MLVVARPPKTPGAWGHRSQKNFKVVENIEARKKKQWKNSYKTGNYHLKTQLSVFKM